MPALLLWSPSFLCSSQNDPGLITKLFSFLNSEQFLLEWGRRRRRGRTDSFLLPVLVSISPAQEGSSGSKFQLLLTLFNLSSTCLPEDLRTSHTAPPGLRFKHKPEGIPQRSEHQLPGASSLSSQILVMPPLPLYFPSPRPGNCFLQVLVSGLLQRPLLLFQPSNICVIPCIKSLCLKYLAWSLFSRRPWPCASLNSQF